MHKTVSYNPSHNQRLKNKANFVSFETTEYVKLGYTPFDRARYSGTLPPTALCNSIEPLLLCPVGTFLRRANIYELFAKPYRADTSSVVLRTAVRASAF